MRLAHPAIGGRDDGGDVDIPEPQPEARTARRRGPRQSSAGAEGSNVVRLSIGAGRQAGIRPADLVGAIANEAGVAYRDLGAIEIADRYSLVEVPADAADEIVKALRKTTLRGQKVQVRRDRDA